MIGLGLGVSVGSNRPTDSAPTNPTVVVTGPATHDGSNFVVTATYSEDVSPVTTGGFGGSDDITAVGATVVSLNVVSGSVYEWTMFGSASIDVSVPAGGSNSTGSGLPNLASNTITITRV